MGVGSTKLNVINVKSETESLVKYDFKIPYDLLIHILSFVSSEDLIKRCRLVSRLWKDVIDGHSVWKMKCERENKHFPNLKLEKIPSHYYRLIYLHNPYGTNLINNPCGESSLNDWILVSSGGDGFAIESPPNGADPVPPEVGSNSCFATSFSPCEKYQLIDLVKRGVHPDVLDCKTTKFEIGEWYAARFDCACVYKLKVVLLNNNYDKVGGTLNWETCEVDRFEFEHNEEQWTGREWHKITHTFESVEKVRYVFFHHFGKDRQFWAGHYGSKMTGAYLKVIV